MSVAGKAPLYHAAIVPSSDHVLVLAIVHVGTNGQVYVDHLKEMPVEGNIDGIAAVELGLRAAGVAVAGLTKHLCRHRQRSRSDRAPG
jgi:hypothetical protein